MKHKPFDSQSGYTMFDNYILDVIMPELKPTHWKVLCFILRKTVGWQKVEDGLSYSQIMEGTGIGNRTTVSGAIKALTKAGYIECIRTEEQNSPNRYRINTDYEVEIEGSTKIVPPSDDDEIGSTKNVPQVVQKSDTQKKGKETIQDASASEGSLSDRFHNMVQELKASKNKPAILREIYIMCHGEEAAPDYGYLGKVARQVGGAGYLAQRIFELTARPPTGDILAYILAEHKGKKQRQNYNASRNGATSEIQWSAIVDSDIPEYMREEQEHD